MTLRNARKLASKFYHELNHPLREHYLSAFYVAEPFDTREGFHFHTLIKTDMPNAEDYLYYNPRTGKKSWQKGTLGDLWSNQWGLGICQFEKVRSKTEVSEYMSKYMTKFMSDYEFLVSPRDPDIPGGSYKIPEWVGKCPENEVINPINSQKTQ